MSKLLRNGIPRKDNGQIDFRPKRHHGFTTFIWILGFLLPPLAVVIRFGAGKDLLINIPLTICGWIPGQLHNWFIQNVRNNDTRGRTPRWARRYGLVDETAIRRKQKKRAWTGKYSERVERRQVWDDETGQFVVLPEEGAAAAAAATRRGGDGGGGGAGTATTNQGTMDDYREEFYNPDPVVPREVEVIDAEAASTGGSPSSRRRRGLLRKRSEMQSQDRHLGASYGFDPLVPVPTSGPTALDGDDLDRELTGAAGTSGPASPARFRTRSTGDRDSAAEADPMRTTPSRLRSTGYGLDSDDDDDERPEDPTRTVAPLVASRGREARSYAYEASRDRERVALAQRSDEGFRTPSPSSSRPPSQAPSQRQRDVMEFDHQF